MMSLLTQGVLRKDSDQEGGTATTATTPSRLPPTFTSSNTAALGLLVGVAVLYGTLNVTLRAVYAQPNPPTAAALSAVRGWMAVLCFVPLLWWETRHPRHHSTTTTTTVELSPMLHPHYDTIRQKNDNNNNNNNLDNNQTKRVTWKGEPDTDDNGLRTTPPREEEEDAPPNDNNNPQYLCPSLGLVAFELAVWNGGAQALINTGLVTIASAARAAFLTQLSVVITPLLSYAVTHRRPSRTVGMACGLALLGLT